LDGHALLAGVRGRANQLLPAVTPKRIDSTNAAF